MPDLSAADAVFVGEDEASAVYQGATEVWSSVPPFSPGDIVGLVDWWLADDLSAVGDGNAVSAWASKVNAWSLAQTLTKRPLYRASGIGGAPAVDFDGTDDLLVYAATDAVSTATSGHVFTVLLPDVEAVRAVWGSSDEASAIRYLMSVYRTDVGKSFDVEQRSNTGSDVVYGTTTAVDAGSAAFVELNSTGTAWQIRVNNTVQALTVAGGANTGDWFGDTLARDNFTVGGIKSTAEQLFFNGKIAAVIVVNGAISAGDRTALGAWVTAKYGITLA